MPNEPSPSDINPNVDSRVYYMIRHVQNVGRKGKQTTDHFEEHVNQYKTMAEVQERFDWWVSKSSTVLVQVIMSILTSEIVSEWRKGDEVTISNEHTADGNADGGDLLPGSDPTDKEEA